MHAETMQTKQYKLVKQIKQGTVDPNFGGDMWLIIGENNDTDMREL